MLHVINKKVLLLLLLELFLINMRLANLFGQQCPKKFIESKYKKEFYVGDALSQQYPLIGLYKESLIEEDRIHNGEIEKIAEEDSMIVKNAYPFIYNALKMNNIVILNECHNIPLHRKLLYTILDSFKSFGINSVFLESLAYTPDDSSFYSSYPNKNFGGTLMSENIFNQLLLKASSEKLNLYSYEFNPSEGLDTMFKDGKLFIINKDDPKWKPIEADSITVYQLFSDDDYAQRDAMQAIHICQKIISNNIKKAFIYCGYSHVWKERGSMAGILQRLLHKNVYSIDQMMLNEHSDKKYESPLYSKYADTINPVIFLNKKEQPIHKVYFPKYNDTADFIVDMIIASPKTIYLNNRPRWLELDGSRKRYPLSNFIDKSVIEKGCLVLFYDFDVFEKGGYEIVPIDVFQTENNVCQYDAVLTPNKKYRMLVYKDGKIIIEKNVDVL